MFGNLDFSVIGPSLPFIWTGLLFTAKLTLIAMTGGTTTLGAFILTPP